MARNDVLQGPAPKYKLEDVSLGKLFFDCAEKYKDRVCQIDATVDQSETYGSVKLRSVRLAIELRNRGITPKDVIFICSTNSLDNSIPIIACFFLGAKTISIDPVWMIEHIAYLVALVSPTLLFVESSFVRTVETALEEAELTVEIIVFGESRKWFSFDKLIEPQEDEDKFQPFNVDTSDIAVMLLSCGTTGLPKAICHSHVTFTQLTHSLNNCGLQLSRKFHYTSFGTISAMTALSTTFINGYTRVFTRTLPEAEQTLQIVEKYRVTSIFMSTRYTYKVVGAPNVNKYDVSSVGTILLGGTTISVEQFNRIQTIFRKASIICGYGMTEIGLVTCFNAKRDKKHIKKKIGSCGKPTPSMTIKVVNAITRDILGPNQNGEICVKSPGMMIEYYKQDCTDCYDEEGFLKTGDMGYYDKDECFYIVDRLKDVFKYDDLFVVPALVEQVLLEHPAIQEAVVFGVVDHEAERELPAACVVLKENAKATPKEIEKFVSERVSEKERLRGGVMVVPKFPKNQMGIVKKTEVKLAFVEVREQLK